MRRRELWGVRGTSRKASRPRWICWVRRNFNVESIVAKNMNPNMNLHDGSSFIPSSAQMDSLTSRRVCGEGGTGAASLKTRFSTRERRGAVGARRPPGPGWTPWKEERETGTSRNPPAPRL